MPQLTRQEMEQVIAEGGSVLHQGRLISRVQDLPSKAELARGNPQAEAEARADLEQQMSALQRQMTELQQAQADANQQQVTTATTGQAEATLAPAPDDAGTKSESKASKKADKAEA